MGDVDFNAMPYNWIVTLTEYIDPKTHPPRDYLFTRTITGGGFKKKWELLILPLINLKYIYNLIGN